LCRNPLRVSGVKRQSSGGTTLAVFLCELRALVASCGLTGVEVFQIQILRQDNRLVELRKSLFKCLSIEHDSPAYGGLIFIRLRTACAFVPFTSKFVIF
jgi:hypothetical protein